MHAERHAIAVTTDADGDATAYSPVITGRILSIRYVKTDFADGVDFLVTLESTGETVWDQDDVNADATVAPRQATHTTAGVASVYASGGTGVLEPIVAAQDRLKIVVAAGGDTKTGTFHVVVG